MNSELSLKIALKNNLKYEEMSQIMDEILKGKSSVEETANFLKLLTEKGESDQELLAMLDKMQELSIHIQPKRAEKIIDVCGTGGDKMRTFNISTAAAFVVAASGGVVAKHGNRSISGISGSADLFEYFGYDLNMSPTKVQEIIEKFGIGFMFAQQFHPSMKNVAKARNLVNNRTAFNLLGPLCNPANVKHQLIGVYSRDYLSRIISILKSRGSENVMTVISEDGLDELTTTSNNHIWHFNKGKVINFVLEPTKLGLNKGNILELQVSTKEEAVHAFIAVLKGTAKQTMIETTALNSAAGLIVGGISERFDEALEISLQSIKNGKAYQLFIDFVSHCGDKKKLELEKI